MTDTLIVVDKLSDWEPYSPSDRVMTFADYLSSQRKFKGEDRVRIINLCRSYRYLSDGYYCSLLAEARGHHVIPSVRVLSDLGKRSLYMLHLDDLSPTLGRALQAEDRQKPQTLRIYFGRTGNPAFQNLGRMLFERFPCPVLEATLRYQEQWEITSLKMISPHGLDDASETEFANALDEFSRAVWRRDKSKKSSSRYDLAILVEPGEAMPPSNEGALKRFIRAGEEMDIDVELITQKDFVRLPEFDGLFIRVTTAIDHYTYRFAKKAEAEGLVVLDDPTSILRCTNKVYLADLFHTNKVPTPKTMVLHRGNHKQLDELEATIGFPAVIKIPDGSFSRGITKVENREQLLVELEKLFQKSTLVLAQEFLYTDFDWRIGILNNKPLYACRYFMVKDHWQIYQHDSSGGKTASGESVTMPTFEVPKGVLEAAMKATRPIGDGFYGVDLKEKNGKGYVIEVNDNPNIDRGVEDEYLDHGLYERIMEEFLYRMAERRRA